MKALHTQLRERRRAMHLTQAEVARRVGLSRRAYVGIEHGAGTTVATMQAIGEVLGLRLTFSVTVRISKKNEHEYHELNE